MKEILIVRHGERVDNFIKDFYGLDHTWKWVEKCREGANSYAPCHKDLPRTLPPIPGGLSRFQFDTPLTPKGYQDAVLYGEQLAEQGYVPNEVYASPALRSIETAKGLIEGLKANDLKIKIEPGLLEIFWRDPDRFLPEELYNIGYPIDLDYTPQIEFHTLNHTEPKENYYYRCHKLMKHAISQIPKEGLALVVAHGTSVDSCTRILRGEAPLCQDHFERVLPLYPWRCYLLTALLQQKETGWGFAKPPRLPTKELQAWNFQHGLLEDVARNLPKEKHCDLL